MSERFRNYSPPISPDLRSKYESALSNEWRWQGGMQFSDKDENVLDHVADEFEIHDEVGTTLPALFSEVDTPETPHMFYLHDGGEILAHDLSHSVPNYEAERIKRKRRESAAFRLLTRTHINDVELKAYARQLYKRYEEKRPDDKIANYVQLIDKVQATRFGLRHVFSGKKLGKSDARKQQINHAYGLHIVPASQLIVLLGQEAQGELMEFMDQELARFRKFGYSDSEVTPYRQMMKNTLQEEVTSL